MTSPLRFRRLAELLRLVLAEEDMESVLARIAVSLDELIGCDAVVIWENGGTELLPLHAYGRDAELMRTVQVVHGEGITGLAASTREPVCANDAHLDPRAVTIPDTPPDEPESIIAIPLIAREQLIGVLSLYRCGDGNAFPEADFELAGEFADLAAVALENARTREHLQQLAGTDDLTGLPNRRRFFEELTRELSRATRASAHVALLIVDIDEFKLINDCYGHSVGDQLLRATADELVRRVRQSDLVARIGGDEFAILLPDTGLEQAQQLSERLTQPIVVDRRTMKLSVGAAATDTGASDLYDDADALLLRAKRTREVRTRTRPGGQRRQARRDATIEATTLWIGPPSGSGG
jgi:diguanylate cyclase (GGDEF)-like protein